MSETQDSESSTAEKRPHDEMEDDLESKRHRSSSHDAGYERGHHRGGGHGEKYEIRILIPSHTAGAIIGKGGSNIRDLRHEFNASIQVPDSQGFERVVAAVTTTKEDAANLCGKIVDALCERMHQQDRFSTLKMLVHKSQAGTIIGLKGSRIKELREITGAYIKVNQECCPDSTDRVCQVKGTSDVIAKCVIRVLDLLKQAPPKGPSKNYDPNFYDENYEYGGFGNERPDNPRNRNSGRGGRGSYRGGGRFDRGDQFSSGGGGYGMKRGGGRQQNHGPEGSYSGPRFGGNNSRRPYGGYDEDGYGDFDEVYEDPYNEDNANAPVYNNYEEQQEQQEPDGEKDEEGKNSDGDLVTTNVTIPNACIGSIIGKAGQKIRQIRYDSGAMISISEPEHGESDRVITITGTHEQTQNAQYLMQRSAKRLSTDKYWKNDDFTAS